jgi:hypothetical protein
MQDLNETEIQAVAGAVTEGGCIPPLPGEQTLRQLLERLTGTQTPTAE